MEKTTLIVGAGPTGLAAAIEFRRFGLPVRLIDKSDHAARWSQALVVQSRTLEQFQRYGIADEAVSRGRIIRVAHFHDGRESLARLQLSEHIPGRFPFALCLPQNDTEDILTKRLRTLGVEIERGVELTGFSNTAAGHAVTAHLRHADGRQERADFRFLLGCDGAHSFVRSGTLTPFTGDTVPERFALGDLTLTGSDVPGDEMSLYFYEGGWALFILQLPDGQHRIITIFPRDGSDEHADHQPPSLDDFNEDFKRFGLHMTATASSWLAPFRVNERKARQYRHGNVFLLGDAAHIHSPVGGQGMNTGIQDAANLAWKLAGVLDGAPDSLLNSYDKERGPVAHGVLLGSAFGLRMAGNTNPLVEKVRNFVLKHALGTDFVANRIAPAISETGIHYRGSSIVLDAAPSGPLRAGDRMPDPDLPDDPTGTSLLMPLVGSQPPRARHLMISIDMPAADIPGDLKNVHSIELRNRSALETTLGRGPLLYLVRPDGYIGFRGTGNGDKLRAYAAAVGLL